MLRDYADGVAKNDDLAPFKPSETYMTPYLKQIFTDQQLDDIVFPCKTYGYTTALLILGIMSFIPSIDVFPVLMIAEIFNLIYRAIPLFPINSVTVASIMEFCNGVAGAGSVLYFGTIYSLCRSSSYTGATSITRGSLALGHCLSSGLAQVAALISPNIPYDLLFILSFLFEFLSLLILLFLPTPKAFVSILRRRYGYRTTAHEDDNLIDDDGSDADDAEDVESSYITTKKRDSKENLDREAYKHREFLKVVGKTPTTDKSKSKRGASEKSSVKKAQRSVA
ncbi:Reduced folate carrier like protein, partial [Aduncisulcus paluster]